MPDPDTDPTADHGITPTAAPTTHPDFANPEDIVLRSADNVRFNVARRDLERTSGWFRGMFEAASRSAGGGTSEEIPVFEDAATLEPLLKLALGLKLKSDSLASCDACESALMAAKKYDMDGVAQSILIRLRVALLDVKDPVLEYIISCRHDMLSVREAALEQCSRMEIDFTRLRGMDGDHIAQLVIARHQRTEDINFVLSEATDGTAPCYYPNNGLCPCCRGVLNPGVRATWEQFIKTSMRRSLHVPSMEGILSDPEVSPAYQTLLATPCSNRTHPFAQIKTLLLAAVTNREAPRARTF